MDIYIYNMIENDILIFYLLVLMFNDAKEAVQDFKYDTKKIKVLSWAF